MDLLPNDVFQIGLMVFVTHALRYFVLAGVAFLVWYRWLKPSRKLQKRFPKPSDYQREIGYSLLTFGIFSLVAMALYNPVVRPYTHTYYDVSAYGMPYLIGSFFLMLLIHDTYFYWMHRLMHHPKLFKFFHVVHHRSTNPSPWAAFAFQPTEALIEAGIFIVFAFTLPLHIYPILAFFVFMTVYNVYGHLGWELYPAWFLKSRAGKWLNTSTSHNLHHEHFRDNYGLYFLFWDRWLGTYRKKEAREVGVMNP